MPDVLVVAGLSLAAAALVMTLTTVWATRVGRVSVVDVAWGAALSLVALVCAVLGGTWQCWLLFALVAAWAGRLSSHIFVRSRGRGEDPRYRELMGGDLAEVGVAHAVRTVFLVQGAAVWLVSLPLQAAAVAGLEWSRVVWAGMALWVLGMVFESVGDAQLAAYKRDPHRGPVMDRGLWGWSRHPNYFGDACVWWGLWLAGGMASGWVAGLVTVVSPVAMTIWLVWITGARLLERTMRQRPGYPQYAARTSMFVPLPPSAATARDTLSSMDADRVADAFAAVPRECFLPESARARAAHDGPIDIGHGQTNSQPRTVAAMLRLLDVRPGQRVLDVGAGSGWTTGLLAHLTGPEGEVRGLELEPDLVRFGRANLARGAWPWARIDAATPGALGDPAGAPYDRVLVSAEARQLPAELVAQLGEGGRMVAPVDGVMLLVEHSAGGTRVTRHGHYRFVPLR